MPPEMVLNELSLTLADTDLIAQERISRLIAVYRAATGAGFTPGIRLCEELKNPLLAPNYTLAHWRNDERVDRDLRNFFRTITTKLWLIKDEDGATINQQAEVAQVFVEDKEALGLKAVLYLDGIGISLSSDAQWNAPFVEVRHDFLDNEDVVSETVSIRHANDVHHLDSHTEWIQQYRATSTSTGADLWDKRAELFPNLDFCNDVRTQLIYLSPTMFDQVRKRLEELNQLSQQWQTVGGDFANLDFPSKITTESTKTMEQYGHLREFRCPDGQTREFSWHSRFTPLAGRIHFFTLDASKRCIVGYIGKKLRTATSGTI